jgi:ABC-type methionine transport system ATPase subunit
VLRGKFTGRVPTLIKAREISNSLMMYLRLQEKQEQTKSKISKQEEIIKRVETNEIETKNPYKYSSGQKNT